MAKSFASTELLNSSRGLLRDSGWVLACTPQTALSQQSEPSPLLEQGHPIDWWFAFKLNAAVFPGCNESQERVCAFGGKTSFVHGTIGH